MIGLYLKHVGNMKHAGSTEDEKKIKEMNEGSSDPDKKKKFVKEDVSTKFEEIYPSPRNCWKSDFDFGLEVDGTKYCCIRFDEEGSKDVKETLRSDQDLSECLNTSSMEFKEYTSKKHEAKQFQQSCLGEDCWELYIPDLSMAVPAITISANVSEESVTSVVSRVILFSTIPTEIPIILNMPTDLPTVSELPAVSPFLCLDDSESESADESPGRQVSLRLHDDMISRYCYSVTCLHIYSSHYRFTSRSYPYLDDREEEYIGITTRDDANT
ncbi:hypothetical protein Tco_0952424 [Tanacetum coccineum]|uniref:Uncharacterized protein n=1 Tax=Tanacetum coccineum TaxID=301880 RepID=A0ABQ5E2W5_9ASTR